MNQITINNIKDTNSYFQLIQNMMAGEVITINESNAFFLNYIATTLGNDELKSVTNIFMVRYERNYNNRRENYTSKMVSNINPNIFKFLFKNINNFQNFFISV